MSTIKSDRHGENRERREPGNGMPLLPMGTVGDQLT